MTIPAQRTSRAFNDIGEMADVLWPAGAGTKKGVVPHHQVLSCAAATTLANVATDQSPFPAAADTVALAAATTYRFRGLYSLITGATTHTTATGFLLVTATLAAIRYLTIAHSAADDTIAAAQNKIHEAAASSVATATSTAVETTIMLDGMLRTTLGGTLQPIITFSADPTGACTADINTYFEIWPVGASTITGVGNVA